MPQSQQNWAAQCPTNGSWSSIYNESWLISHWDNSSHGFIIWCTESQPESHKLIHIIHYHKEGPGKPFSSHGLDGTWLQSSMHWVTPATGSGEAKGEEKGEVFLCPPQSCVHIATISPQLWCEPNCVTPISPPCSTCPYRIAFPMAIERSQDATKLGQC